MSKSIWEIAICKSMMPNVSNTHWNNNTAQRRATTKYIIPNASNTIRNYKTTQ